VNGDGKFATMIVLSNAQNMKVCTLLDAMRYAWDMDLIHQLFNDREKDLIFGIPTSEEVATR